MSDPAEPVSTPCMSELTIPLPVVAPLLGLVRAMVQDDSADRDLRLAYDHAARSIGIPDSAEIHANGNAASLKKYRKMLALAMDIKDE